MRRYEVWCMIRGSLLGVLRDMRHDSGEVTVAFPIPTRYRLFSLSEAESLWKSEYTAKCEVISSAESNNVMFMLHETPCSSSKSDDRQVCIAHPAKRPRASVLHSGSYLASSNHSFAVFIQLLFYISRFQPLQSYRCCKLLLPTPD